MPTVHNQTHILAPPDLVFAIARDVERFPDFMPEVRRTTILESHDDGRRQLVEWVGVIPAVKLTIKWTEEDIWDEVERTCRFTQVKGDFTAYGGTWRFIPEGDGVRFESEVNYELEIPTVGPLIKGLVRKIMSDNAGRLLEAIKRRAEAT